GYPGDLIMRFGTQAGSANVGEAHIPARKIDPTFDMWWEGHVKPVQLDPAKEYYFELSAASGSISEGNYYVVYGPKPLGGTNYPPDLPVAYQVLTEAQPHASAEYQRFKFVQEFMSPYQGGPSIVRTGAKSQDADITVTPQWSILAENSDQVVITAANDLRELLQNG